MTQIGVNKKNGRTAHKCTNLDHQKCTADANQAPFQRYASGLPPFVDQPALVGGW